MERKRQKLTLGNVNKINDDACYINTLPNEVIEKIFSFLTQNQLGQIARVCRKWNVLKKSPVLWKKVKVKFLCSADIEKDAQSLKSFIDGLPSCAIFIRLEFSRRDNLDFKKYLDFEKFCMELLHKCRNVEELILIRCSITTNPPEAINFCTQYLQSLKKLVLHDCWFRDNSRTVELEENSKIEVLDFYDCNISDSRKIQFSKLPSLKELRLNKTYVFDTWFVGEASLLNQLQVLDLGYTNITSETFLAIQRHGQNLKELYLCGYLRLRDHDLHFNGPVFPHLQTICLSRTLVTCEGLVSLVRSCPSLVSVYVAKRLVRPFAEHPFVVANRCKSGIVKSFVRRHDHNADYLHN